MHILAGLNIILGLVAISLLLSRTTQRWSEYPDEIRLLLLVTLALFAALIGTSAGQFVGGDQANWNTLLISAAKVFSIWVLWKTRATKYRTGTRTPNGNLGQDQNRDV